MQLKLYRTFLMQRNQLDIQQLIIIYKMQNKTNIQMDSLKMNENKKITKHLDAGQHIILSATVIKINHVNKRQERALAVSNKNVINLASPNSIMPNRIKRKIALNKIIGISTSRFGNQIVIHVDSQQDYRFFTANLKIKYIQTIIIVIGRATNKPVKIYWYDDLALDQYTTTIVQISSKKRKPHKTEPIIVDQDYLKKNVLSKPQSKLIFKGSNNQNVQNFEQFDIIKVLGRGAYGKVMLCKHQKTGGYYAVKSMRKEDLVDKDSIQRTKTQRFLLQKVRHPFLVNLQYAFQTKQKIFLIMQFFRGGQMFSKIKKQKRFTEKRTKFYAAQVFSAIQYLHKMGYVYRDLKPENILFDMNGYIKVSDYGLSKQLKNGEKTHSLTGTASYLSPEVIMNEGHSYTVDWWSLGVLIYQMLFSIPPFYCKDQRQMFARIVNKELQFPKEPQISQQCRQLLIGLLSKYPHKRLGHEGSQSIKNHTWFKDIDWNALLQLKIVPDYIPSAVSDDDVSNFLDIFTSEEPVDTIVNCDINLLKKFDKQFEDFNFKRYQSMQQPNKRQSMNPEFSNSNLKQQSSVSTPNFSRKK